MSENFGSLTVFDPAAGSALGATFVSESPERILQLFVAASRGGEFRGLEPDPVGTRQYWIPRSVYDAVDVSDATMLVLPPSTLSPHAAVRQVDGRFTIDDLPGYFGGQWLPDTFNVAVHELRIWRGRFLMIRDLLFHALVCDDFRHVGPIMPEIGSYSARNRILGRYFPKGVFIPGVGNPIRQMFEPAKPPHEVYFYRDGSIDATAFVTPAAG